MNPEGAGSVPGSPTPDMHHVISVADGIELEFDWTASVHSPVLSSPKLADIDMDGDLDVIIQSSDGWVDVLDDNGSSMSGWPVSGNWGSNDPDVKASPAIVNLVGDLSTAPEILAVHPSGCNGLMGSGTSISGWAGIYSSTYEWHAMSSPVAGDFDNNSDYEYLLGRQHGTPPANGEVFYGQEDNGVSIWSKNWGFYESVASTPSLCDVDNDGDLEALVITDYYTFPSVDDYGTLYCLDASTGVVEWSYYPYGMFIWGAVTTANLDSDPQMEIIASGTVGGPVTIVLDGLTHTPEYARSTGTVWAGASIGDVDSDGDLDVVVSSSSEGGTLHCWDGATGDYLPGFPLALETFTKCGVSIGDINADGYLEILIAGRDGKLHSINYDGTETGGFPITVSSTPLSGQPALGDIDGDGRLEIIFGEQNNNVLHCYEMGDNSAYSSIAWPQFQFDAMNSGCYSDINQPPGPPLNLQGPYSILGDKILVDLTWNLSPNDPGDVTEYRIYRRIFPYGGLEQIGSVSSGVTTYFDTFRIYPYYGVVRYHLTAWDGEFESEESNGVRINLQPDNCISAFCPVSEVFSSQAIDDREDRDSFEPVANQGCSVLTDGQFSRAYTPSGFAECVEIDLGTIYQVENVSVIMNTADGMNREETESLGLCSYSLSTDGSSFTSIEAGAARYVRVYGAAGATEIEVCGTSDAENSSALIDVVRNNSGAFTAQSVTGEELTLQVFDLMGRTIWQGTSIDQVSWPSVNSSGNRVPSGVYLLRVESESMETLTTKVIVR